MLSPIACQPRDSATQLFFLRLSRSFVKTTGPPVDLPPVPEAQVGGAVSAKIILATTAEALPG
jgi:hypothetical protein